MTTPEPTQPKQETPGAPQAQETWSREELDRAGYERHPDCADDVERWQRVAAWPAEAAPGGDQEPETRFEPSGFLSR